MSAATDYTDRLNLAELVSRIERQQAETRKFSEDAIKLVAEQHKLIAEAQKLQRDRSLSPWLAGGAVAGGVVTLATLLLRALGALT